MVSVPGDASREELLAALAERDAVIDALLVRIEVLERRVGMDSSNSSMPPGSDGPAARARRAKQRKKKQSPNRRGGQPGHDGRGLARVAVPDRVKVLSPAGCGGCGQALSGMPGPGSAPGPGVCTPPGETQGTRDPVAGGGRAGPS